MLESEGGNWAKHTTAVAANSNDSFAVRDLSPPFMDTPFRNSTLK
jgi:hypothetical protein